jgi:threonine dehydratase
MITMTNIVRTTNFIQAPTLSALLGANITFADETKQHTGSFKFRAAYNVVSNIPQEHIIVASSGNFAQALSYACSLLNKKCTVVMPNTSAQVKIDGVKEYGGHIEFVDTTKNSRAARLGELAKECPDAYVTNAYDNPLIIEGNKSLGIEIAAYSETFDYIISPIGGGGLISGIILGIKEYASAKLGAVKNASDKIHLPTIIGAEPSLANDAARSIKSGELIANDFEPQTIADGARTISLGKHNWEIIKDNLKQIIEVSDEQIKTAVKLIFDHVKIKAEPTGALPLAAVLIELDLFEEKNICCVISGGNIDDELFESIMQ